MFGLLGKPASLGCGRSVHGPWSGDGQVMPHPGLTIGSRWFSSTGPVGFGLMLSGVIRSFA